MSPLPALSQRRLFAAVIWVSSAGVLPVFLLGGLAVQVRGDLGFAESTQGWMVFGYFGVSAVTSATFGRLVERIGPVAGMRVATVLAAVALAAAAFSPNAGVLVAALGLGGLANSLAQPGSNALIVAGVPLRRNGLAFGIKQSAIPAATLLAGLAVPTVGLTLGWRWAFAGASVLALAAVAAVPPVGRPPAGRRRRSQTRDGERSGPGTAEAGDPKVATPRRPPGRPDAALATLALLGVGSGLGAAMANCLGAFLTSAAVDSGVAPGLAGALLAAGSVMGLTSRVALGWRADTMTANHFRVVVVMLALGAGGLVLLAAGRPTIFVAGTALAFGAGWAWPGLFNLAVVAHNRRAPAAATGITQTGTYAGGAVGPLVFGYLVHHGGYSLAWLFFGAVALAAAAVIEAGRSRIEATAGVPARRATIR